MHKEVGMVIREVVIIEDILIQDQFVERIPILTGHITDLIIFIQAYLLLEYGLLDIGFMTAMAIQ